MSGGDCQHGRVSIDGDMVCCVDCGELLDPIKMLGLFLDTESMNRKRLTALQRSNEQLSIDLRRQQRDLKAGAESYGKLQRDLRLARSELSEINQKIKERAPTLNQLMKELQ